jgi:hypothetical protein
VKYLTTGAGRVALPLVAAVCLLSSVAASVRDPEPLPIAQRVDEAITGAVEWLVANQGETGAWGSHHSPRPIEVFCGVPGGHQAFRVGTTGLCVMALIDSGVESVEVRSAIDRGIGRLLEECVVKRMSGLEHYNVWAFGYSLQCFGEYLARFPDGPRGDEIRKTCEVLVEKVGRYQALDGGWGYLSLDAVPTYQPSFTSMSFTTATILVGLQRVREQGIEVSQKLIDRAIASLDSCKTPLGTFTYGPMWNRTPTSGANHPKGAACRAPACLYSIDLFRDDVEQEEYAASLQDLLVKYKRFQIVGLRRPIPHESWYQISGYFYLYGHAYAGYVLELLDEREQRRFSPAMAEAVLHTQQPDGSFWDYPLYSYHKPYGTAYALIALTRLTFDR